MVVLGHPNQESFNHAIATTAVKALQANGHEVIFHDLYAEGFDPVLTQEEFTAEEVSDAVVKAQCDQVAAADALVVIHPNWWGQPPAMVKGWMDRVLRFGVAYTFEEENGEEVAVGLLRARSALILNTCMTTEENDRSQYGDPLERLWKNSVLGFCGVTEFHRLNFRMVQTVSQEEREAMLESVVATVNELYPADV
ncbi:MAG: NAD(P)H-dependent oxidoreductase [bacterium]